MYFLKKQLLVVAFLVSAIEIFASGNGHYTLDVEKQHITVNDVTDYFSQWFNIDGNVSFREMNINVDDIGMKHIAYQQYYQDLIVDGGMVIVHSRNNIVQSVTASVMEVQHQDFSNSEQQLKKSTIPNANIVLVPITTEQETFYKKAYLYYDEEQQANIYEDIESGEILRIEPRVFYDMVTEFAYTRYNGWQTMDCYRENNLFRLSDTERHIHTLDASEAVYTGEVTDYRNESKVITSPSSKWSAMLSSVKITRCDDEWLKDMGFFEGEPDLFIKVFSSNGTPLDTIERIDEERTPLFSNINLQLDKGSYVVIYDYDDLVDDIGDTIYITNIEAGTISWNKENTSGFMVLKGNPAVDAHWGMQQVYDFYKEKFDQNGYNNKGTNIFQFIDPYALNNTHKLANAYATYDKNGVGFMCYGLGNDTIDAVVALDIIAHEYTHLIIDFNGKGGLASLGESGALNESFADIMGCAVEHYVLSSEANWDIGESVMLTHSNLRSLKNPKKSLDGLKPQPDTYKGTYWIDISNEENDKGGIHTNSGVQNKWFYLLCEGGSGINDNGAKYTVAGIGIEKAQRIAFANMKNFLTKNATYLDARDGSLLAAKYLYGESSSEYKSVVNAWYAVGVGTFMYSYEDDNPETNVFSIEEEPLVKVSNRDIIIDVPYKTDISVYSVDGKCVFRKGNVQSVQINNMLRGLFIIKIGSYQQKIFIQ